MYSTCVGFQLRRESERERSEVHESLSEHNSIDTRETLSVPHPVLYTALKNQCLRLNKTDNNFEQKNI